MAVPVAEAQHRLRGPSVAPASVPHRPVARCPSAPSATLSSLSRRPALATACRSPLTLLRQAPRPRTALGQWEAGPAAWSRPCSPAPVRLATAVWRSACLGAWGRGRAGGVRGRTPRPKSSTGFGG